MKKVIGTAVVSLMAMSGNVFAHVGDHSHVETSHFFEHLVFGGVVVAAIVAGFALLRKEKSKQK